MKIKELVSEVRKWYFTEFILLAAFVLEFRFFRPDSLVHESMDKPELKLSKQKSQNNWFTSIHFFSNTKTITKNLIAPREFFKTVIFFTI